VERKVLEEAGLRPIQSDAKHSPIVRMKHGNRAETVEDGRWLHHKLHQSLRFSRSLSTKNHRMTTAGLAVENSVVAEEGLRPTRAARAGDAALA